MDTEACTDIVIHEQFVAVCFHVLVFLQGNSSDQELRQVENACSTHCKAHNAVFFHEYPMYIHI